LSKYQRQFDDHVTPPAAAAINNAQPQQNQQGCTVA